MNTKKHYYSVYNAKTDMPVMIHGTAEECAKCMGVKNAQAFYETKFHVKNGSNKRWVILEDEDD